MPRGGRSGTRNRCGGAIQRNQVLMKAPQSDQTRVVWAWVDTQMDFTPLGNFNPMMIGNRITQQDVDKFLNTLKQCPNCVVPNVTRGCFSSNEDSFVQFNAVREQQFRAVADQANSSFFNSKEVNWVVGGCGAYVVLEYTFMAKQMAMMNPMMPQGFQSKF